MDSALLNEALRILAATPVQPGAVSRELVVAYATVAAWVHHWPSRASLVSRQLVEEFAWIRDIERDRYIKQRRVALARLAQSERP